MNSRSGSYYYYYYLKYLISQVPETSKRIEKQRPDFQLLLSWAKDPWQILKHIWVWAVIKLIN